MTSEGAPISISAVVLTHNEERNLPKCLASIAGRASEIVVVDSYSTDSTLQIAAAYTDKIVQHAYESHPQQWDWTLKNAPICHDWIFAIDADFIVTPELWNDLARRIDDLNVDAYYVRHREVFRGRRISFGGVYPNKWLRIFRRSKVMVDLNELVDIHFFVSGPAGSIEHDVEEQNFKDDSIYFWIQKQNVFARRHAAEEIDRKGRVVVAPVTPSLFGSRDQRKLFLKRIWYQLPLYIRPFLYFFYRYVLRLGFLDGKEGFVYHFTQGFLYRLLVDINIDEMLSKRDHP